MTSGGIVVRRVVAGRCVVVTVVSCGREEVRRVVLRAVVGRMV